MSFKCKIFSIVFLKKSLHSLRSGNILSGKITEKDVLKNLINFVYPLRTNSKSLFIQKFKLASKYRFKKG